MEASLDVNALNNAMTLLDFIFMFAIVSCNGILIVKLFSLCSLLRNQRHCLILGLAFGTITIVIVSYTNLLLADIRGDKQNLSKVIVFATFTLLYGFPLVYSLALLTLGIDIGLRKLQFSLVGTTTVWNVAVASAPWIVGLLISFPLIFTNIKWEEFSNGVDVMWCQLNQTQVGNSSHYQLYSFSCWTSMRQYRAMLLVCDVIPPCVAFFLCLTLRACFRLKAPESRHPEDESTLYNAVTDSQTIQTLDYKSAYNVFSVQRSSSSHSGSDFTEDNKTDYWLPVPEINLLTLITFLAVTLNLLWPMSMLGQSFVSLRTITSVELNLAALYVSQFVPVIVPAIWIWRLL